ncbi:hypothetical protein IAU60_003285 [Kwoniella sp. DSM 27419]
MVIISLDGNDGLSTLDSALQPQGLRMTSDTKAPLESVSLTDSPPDSPGPEPGRYQPPSGPSKLGFDTGTPVTQETYHPSASSSPSRGRRETNQPDYEAEEGQHAGPSSHGHGNGHGHGARAIPPPPNPRRHRSGVLMSRVRAASSGAAIKFSSGSAGSKSHGDLTAFGGFTALHADDDDHSDGIENLDDGDGAEEGRRGWKRHVSEGSRNVNGDEAGEDNVWDNSARYYHHLHSHPASQDVSRAASRAGSPEHSPLIRTRSITSPHTSPIYVRRNLTLPSAINGPGPPAPGAGMSASLSPNHHFLQTHLPPTFSQAGSSPEQSPHEHHHASSMVFTPTTQEWKDLQATPEWQEMHAGIKNGAQMVLNYSGSSSDDDEREKIAKALKGEAPSHAQILEHRKSDRPGMPHSVSAEYLGPEATHTPDPGSPEAAPVDSDTLPAFDPVIIAPSPIMPVADRVETVQVSPTKQSKESISTPVTPLDTHSNEHSDEQIGIGRDSLDDDDITLADPDADSPVRFASIGRRDSLRVIKKPGEQPPLPRTKTKRELEREKLLSLVDEDTEADDTPANGWGGGVQEIGSGFRLGSISTPPDVRIDPDIPSRPSSADPVMNGGNEPANPFENDFTTKGLTPRGKGIHISPTATFKPSPLQASPVTAPGGLPTSSSASSSPAETPAITNATSAVHSPYPTPPPPGSNLATIRDYARNLQTRSRHPTQEKTLALAKEASPPMSPRSPRRRDTNRVSLVAGRVVQPFTIPPSTALPPPSRPALDRQISLQSFSPFRSPSLNATKASTSAAGIPPFQRLDSTISLAPSTGAPSECGTPTDETAGGIGGRGIDDYVILKEAGKGAYGLVMRAKVKGPKGEPIGDEVIIKYIIKARILADCWKKHKVLGPIPVELHVMDQLRHLLYHKPNHMLPWDPSRPRAGETLLAPASPATSVRSDASNASANSPESHWASAQAVKDSPSFVSTQKYIAAEIKTSPERGHPNIGKLLDFFEDREFYYLVMPRFGTGLDLFDHVESSPSGLNPFEVRSLVGQLADAVRFLHANGIVHRDIKDENVILDGNGRCQLIDFGSAAHWRPGKRWDTFSGTLHYASPEILRGEMYGGKEQDIWALGVVGYVLLVGETPFSDLPDEVLEGLSPHSRAYEVLDERCGATHSDEGAEEDGGGRLADAADLVKRCLELEMADRPSAEVLVDHRYLKGQGGWAGRRGWVKK